VRVGFAVFRKENCFKIGPLSIISDLASKIGLYTEGS
jgi:hypothetical protein